MVELGGDESLSLPAADAIAARWGASVVLIAGEHNAGKTTLLAELYGQFLKGEFDGWSFAGSDCLIALDRRLQGARGIGPGPPEIDHTVDEDMRLIDLRLRNQAGERVCLLLSDIKGEFVRQIVEGAPAHQELPLAVRADLTMVVIDGEKVASVYHRGEALTRARLLIGALTEPGGIRVGCPVLLVLSKGDLLDTETRSWFEAKASKLRAFAETRGVKAGIIVTAARPLAMPHKPAGLTDLLSWLVTPRPSQSLLDLRTAVRVTRSFWTITGDPTR
ncbi:MAG: hypothetical protein WBD40_17165 [Tepidisphaeraceae bacterium]